MIDWITARIPIRAAAEFKTGLRMSVDADGVLEWISSKRMAARGSHESTISMKKTNDREIEFAGSPAKFLQGHNIFGSDDLIGVGAAMITRACQALGIELLDIEMRDIRSGNYRLLRVDVNFSFATGSRSNSLGWIQQAGGRGSLEHRGPARLYGTSTAIWGEKSRHWTLKAYSKGAEIAAPDHKLPLSLPARDHLTAWCDDKLRVEIQFMSRHLQKLNLDTARSWSKGTPRRVFREYLSKLRLPENAVLNVDCLEALPLYLRLTHSAWTHGENLKTVMPKAKYYRHRAELMALGINIAAPYQRDCATTIPLRKYLEVPFVEVPKWAIEAGLYFDPVTDPAHGQLGWRGNNTRHMYSVTSTQGDVGLVTPQVCNIEPIAAS